MDREKKKTLTLAILIITIIVLASIYFLWSNFINKGTLTLVGIAPFELEIYGENKFGCNTSPCISEQKTGKKQLILEKEGHKSQIIETEIKLWKNTEIEIEFKINPYITKAEVVPEIKEDPVYELVFDQENQMQKLIKANDDRQRAIVYFPNEIKAPQFFGSENAILIVDGQNIYKIDPNAKTREVVEKLPENSIITGKWSNNGKYFVFEQTNSTYLWILDQNGVHQLNLAISLEQSAWTYDNTLLFAEKLNENYYFGEYSPNEDIYSKTNSFLEIKEAPKNLVPVSNRGEVYFETTEGKYKLVL